MTLKDDLNSLIPRPDVVTCRICDLLKTLPEDEAGLLAEAVSFVSAKKLKAALDKNGHAISEHKIYDHRNICLRDAE